MSMARAAIRNGPGRGRDSARKGSIVLNVPPLIKKSKCRSFHFRYLELCRAKNLTPLPDIRSKSNPTTILDLYGDKLGVSEWLLIIEALQYDQVLQSLAVRMRRSHVNNVVEPIDTEKRARLYRQKPVIYTRFIFGGLVEAISSCVEFNKNLTVLKLEGLPLQDKYIEYIAKALASNDRLKELSFHKSYIGDKGCESVCNTVKYLNCVEKFDLSDCNISNKGAEFVADMIKMQKITRFTEGWEKSLRYRTVDINSISGLRTLNMANNPEMGDEGLRLIAEVLKEDAWVKTIDMENCGLTDRGANIVLDCLDLNNAITDFNIRNNDGISKFLQRSVRDHLGQEDDEKLQEPQYDLSGINGLHSLPKNKKYTVSQLLLHTKTLEEQLSFERMLRKKAEKLNEKLNHQLISFENNLVPDKVVDSKDNPCGYVIVHNESLQSVMKDTQNYRQTHFNRLVNSTVTSPDATPRSEMVTLRKEEMLEANADQLPAEGSCQSETDTMSMAVAAATDVPRKVLKVRKVRSEMKYVEPNGQNNSKKHESKSDHEFANERDFKLNPKVHFESNIGDTVMVNNLEKRRHGGGAGDGNSVSAIPYALGQQHRYQGEDIGDGIAKTLLKKHDNYMASASPEPDMGDSCMHRGNISYERGYIGDGVNINETQKLHNSENKNRNNYHNYNETDYQNKNGQMSQNTIELERNGTNKFSKKRHKNNLLPDFNRDDHNPQIRGEISSKRGNKTPNQEAYLQTVNDLNVDSYMNKSLEELDDTSLDSTLVNSDSELGATLRDQSQKYGPMKVFMRRKKSDLTSCEVDLQEEDNEDTQQILSPSAVYMELQRKKTDRT
ncbi:protein Cep78 homolog [Scaptodrosophila lebanonensis]|uniref:Protein Cep78 homolog n=1 Tax=Drosophila lebanonensis TaxID=7225 RepID=A0A6J2TIN5_DROLE|nr:protein Cep78 homolog [Scaptodrosophila lebanonensis]XP_030375879.1 protein Cep78 homolog [Scaptodrosophila lebanonensis]